MLRYLNIISVLLVISIIIDFTHSLRLVEVRIPNYVIKGSAAQLECLYELDGEALYSVKWYKDGNEFYRYVPRDMPPAQTFLLPGVTVDLHNSSDSTVTLRDVNLQSAGRFRCEVSGEAPSFQTVTEHGDMVVVSLPDQGSPKITGGRPRYQVGDWVRINCTAGRSKPAVQLTWYVNGDEAEPHQVRKYEPIVSGREGLETSVLGLQFRVDQRHFRDGDMKLKCVASLSTFYWRSNEESVEGDRPQKAPVLESRETVYASNSRADPVQASKTDSLMVAQAPNILLLLAIAIAAAIIGGAGGVGAGVDSFDIPPPPPAATLTKQVNAAAAAAAVIGSECATDDDKPKKIAGKEQAEEAEANELQEYEKSISELCKKKLLENNNNETLAQSVVCCCCCAPIDNNKNSSCCSVVVAR